MWTPDEHRDQVKQLAPDLIQTSVEKRSPQHLQQLGISSLLLRYNQVITQEIRSDTHTHTHLFDFVRIFFFFLNQLTVGVQIVSVNLSRARST